MTGQTSPLPNAARPPMLESQLSTCLSDCSSLSTEKTSYPMIIAYLALGTLIGTSTVSAIVWWCLFIPPIILTKLAAFGFVAGVATNLLLVLLMLAVSKIYQHYRKNPEDKNINLSPLLIKEQKEEQKIGIKVLNVGTMSDASTNLLNNSPITTSIPSEAVASSSYPDEKNPFSEGTIDDAETPNAKEVQNVSLKSVDPAPRTPSSSSPLVHNLTVREDKEKSDQKNSTLKKISATFSKVKDKFQKSEIRSPRTSLHY